MPAEILLLIRWVHFLSGITWIGLLYFFNLVNVPFMKALEPSARPSVVPELLPRALAWFRHSAWVTVLSGFLLIYFLYWQDGDPFNSDADRTIFTGMLLGSVMLFNVWALIWPNQKRVIAATRSGTAPDPAWARTALYASRTNFALSFPMLLFMAGASHLGFDWPEIIVYGLLSAAVGLGIVLSVHKWAAARF